MTTDDDRTFFSLQELIDLLQESGIPADVQERSDGAIQLIVPSADSDRALEIINSMHQIVFHEATIH